MTVFKTVNESNKKNRQANKMLSVLGATTFSIFLISNNVTADNLYVDQKNPIASDKNDGSIAAPWKTLLKATKEADAGDVVTVKAGIYTDPTKFSPPSIPGGFNLKNDGAPDDPIVFKSDPPYTATIKAQRMDMKTQARPAAWILKGKQHIVIDGFKIRGQLRIRDSNNITVINNELLEGSATGNDASVFWGIDIESTSNSLVKNNYVHGLFDNKKFTHNSAAIMVNSESDNNTIEENTVDLSGSAVYSAFGTKGGKPDDNVWRNNFAKCGSRGETGFYLTSSSDSKTAFPSGNQIHNNVIIDCKYAVELNNHIDDPQLIYNNTAYNVNAFFRAKDTTVQNQELWNNIVVNNIRGESKGRRGLYEWGGYFVKAVSGSRSPFNEDTPVSGFNLLLNYSDYNNVSGANSYYAFRIADQTSPEVYGNLAEWKSSTPFGEDSTETDPGFVNPGGKEVGHYKRKSYPKNGRGPVSGTASMDVMGAYITGNEKIGFLRIGIALPDPTPIE